MWKYILLRECKLMSLVTSLFSYKIKKDKWSSNMHWILTYPVKFKHQITANICQKCNMQYKSKKKREQLVENVYDPVYQKLQWNVDQFWHIQ